MRMIRVTEVTESQYCICLHGSPLRHYVVFFLPMRYQKQGEIKAKTFIYDAQLK